MSAHDLTLNWMNNNCARSRAILGRFYAKSKDVELFYCVQCSLETFSEDANPTNAVETMLLGQVLVDVGRTSEALSIT